MTLRTVTITFGVYIVILLLFCDIRTAHSQRTILDNFISEYRVLRRGLFEFIGRSDSSSAYYWNLKRQVGISFVTRYFFHTTIIESQHQNLYERSLLIFDFSHSILLSFPFFRTESTKTVSKDIAVSMWYKRSRWTKWYCADVGTSFKARWHWYCCGYRWFTNRFVENPFPPNKSLPMCTTINLLHYSWQWSTCYKHSTSVYREPRSILVDWWSRNLARIPNGIYCIVSLFEIVSLLIMFWFYFVRNDGLFPVLNTNSSRI